MHLKALFPISPPSSGSRFVHCLSAFSGQRRNLAHYIYQSCGCPNKLLFSTLSLHNILKEEEKGEEEGNVPFFRRPYLCRRSPENRSTARGAFRREGGRPRVRSPLAPLAPPPPQLMNASVFPPSRARPFPAEARRRGPLRC